MQKKEMIVKEQILVKPVIDTDQTLKDLFVETGQLQIEWKDGTVTFCLGIFILVGSAGTVLTLVEFLRSAIVISFHRDETQKLKFLLFGQTRSLSSYTLKFTA